MSQYFDKSFFKFFVGFVAILAISCIIIVGAQMYQASSSTQRADVVHTP